MVTHLIGRSSRAFSQHVQNVATARLNEARATAAMASSWAAAYTDFFAAYPLRANALVSGSLCAVGDGLAQGIELRLNVGESERFDALRTARMTVYGTLSASTLAGNSLSTASSTCAGVTVVAVAAASLATSTMPNASEIMALQRPCEHGLSSTSCKLGWMMSSSLRTEMHVAELTASTICRCCSAGDG